MTKGWGDSEKTCLHGAIRRCAPIKGDAYIIEQVGERYGFGTSFNDEDGWEPVRDRIAQGFDITDEMLEATFGPNWGAVVNVVRTAARGTAEQYEKLAAAMDAARDDAWDAAWAAAWAAVRSAAMDAAMDAAWAAARDAAMDAAWDAARNAAWAAAWAQVVRDLIGKHGLTQEHYDTLMGPWRSVFGEPALTVECGRGSEGESMSAEKFTKGPWKAHTDQGSRPDVDGADGRGVAFASRSPEDAHLIAESPNLYEQLALAVSTIEQLIPEESARGVANVVLAGARAALARARGESA